MRKVIPLQGRVLSVLIVGVGGLAGCSTAPAPEPAPSQSSAHANPSHAAQGLHLNVIPHSGAIGTRVDLTVDGCDGLAASNHALSFNDADVAADRASSREHIHTIRAAVVAGAMQVSYAIPPTSGSAGTFYVQCGGAIASRPFIVTTSSPRTAQAAIRLIAYLDAAARGDCRSAETYVLPTQSKAGDVCDESHDGGGLVFDRWRGPIGRPVQSRGAVEFSVDLHLTKAPLAGGTDRPGWTTWFLEFRKTVRGWLLDNGGTGP